MLKTAFRARKITFKTPNENACFVAERGSEQQSEYPDVRVVNNQLSTAKQCAS